MRKIHLYKFTILFILLNLLLHNALLHNFFSENFICFEQNRNVKLENLESYNKYNSNILNISNNKTFLIQSEKNCTDIYLNVNCYYDNQIIQKQKKVKRKDNLTDLLITRLLLYKKIKINLPFNNFFEFNTTLRSYSKISLLI